MRYIHETAHLGLHYPDKSVIMLDFDVWYTKNSNQYKSFVCLFDLILYVPSTIFQLNKEGSSWVEPVLSQEKCVLLKDHNVVTPVRPEPAAAQSRVKHSTTEPMRSQYKSWPRFLLDKCWPRWITSMRQLILVCTIQINLCWCLFSMFDTQKVHKSIQLMT